MKIMYIINGFGLSDQVGGSVTRSIEITKRLREKGHTIHFLTTIGGFKACKREKLGVRYHVLLTSLVGRKERGTLDRFVAYILSVVVSFIKIPKLPSSQIIYTDSDYFCDVIPAILYKLRFKNAKWVATTHHRISISRRTFKEFVISVISCKLQDFSYLLIRKFSDMVLVLKTSMGRSIRDFFVTKGLPPSKIKFVLNGVDFKALKQAPIVKKEFDACFLGGLRPSKGFFDIVPIWDKVCRLKKNATIVVIGGGIEAYLNSLKEQVSSSGLKDNIKIMGFIGDKTEVFSYLRSSKVFVFPSSEEGWAIPVCEAMALGLPVVAWNLKVYCDIYPKGMVTAPLGDHKAFAVQVLKLLSDKSLYRKLSRDAQRVVSAYEWDKIAEKELELFETALKLPTV